MYVIFIILNMSERTLNDRERNVLLPLIKSKLQETSVEKSDEQIEDALNAYMEAAEHMPEDYPHTTDDKDIVDEVISNYLSIGGRRRSNKRSTARRRRSSKARQSRKARKARKARSTRRR